MKAFEDATGEALDETKKEIASEELIITGGLGEDIGTDKATAIVNDIKTEIIKNNTSDTTQIAETINNVVNNYNVTINANQQQQLEELMEKISKQDYDYKEMKNTLKGISDTIEEKLEAIGEGIDKNFFEKIFETIKGWFTGFGEWISGLFTNKEEDLGILGQTDDSLLGENAIIDATNENAINLPSSEDVEGFFAKIWNWFTGLFKNDNNESTEIDSSINDSTNESSNSDNDIINSIVENETIEENVQPDSTDNSELNNDINSESSETLDNSVENNDNTQTIEDSTVESTHNYNDEASNLIQ